jgi:hypothetical protein
MSTYAPRLRAYFFSHIVDYPGFSGPSVRSRDRGLFVTVGTYRTELDLSPATVQSLTYPNAVLLTIDDPYLEPRRNVPLDEFDDMRKGNDISLYDSQRKCIRSWNLYAHFGTLEDALRGIFPTGYDLEHKKREQARIRLEMEEEEEKRKAAGMARAQLRALEQRLDALVREESVWRERRAVVDA